MYTFWKNTVYFRKPSKFIENNAVYWIHVYCSTPCIISEFQNWAIVSLSTECLIITNIIRLFISVSDKKAACLFSWWKFPQQYLNQAMIFYIDNFTHLSSIHCSWHVGSDFHLIILDWAPIIRSHFWFCLNRFFLLTWCFTSFTNWNCLLLHSSWRGYDWVN